MGWHRLGADSTAPCRRLRHSGSGGQGWHWLRSPARGDASGPLPGRLCSEFFGWSSEEREQAQDSAPDGVIKVIVDGQPYAYTEEDLKFIVAEANNAGRRVAAHAQTQEGARRAARAGVASIEHGWIPVTIPVTEHGRCSPCVQRGRQRPRGKG